eukprot:EC713400.1.p2 GENE.EC713400.1~~EC713400.1.p2  ORF type:complete len:76 (-),score=2.39 EC713400.1:177-404(-)
MQEYLHRFPHVTEQISAQSQLTSLRTGRAHTMHTHTRTHSHPRTRDTGSDCADIAGETRVKRKGKRHQSQAGGYA